MRPLSPLSPHLVSFYFCHDGINTKRCEDSSAEKLYLFIKEKQIQNKTHEGGKHNQKIQNQKLNKNLLGNHREQETLDNEPTQTANKRGLIKGTNQEGTGGRTQTIIR